MKKLLLASAIALAAAGQAYADYQFEVGGVYTDGEIANTNFDGLGVVGEFHFDKVDTSKGPLAEANFLDKSSFVNFAFLSLEPDLPNANDIDATNVGGRFVTTTNIIIEADFSTLDAGNNDTDTIRLGVGTYLNDNSDVVVSYSSEEDDNNNDVDYLNLDFHGVNPLNQGASVAYDVNLGYIDTDTDSGYQIAVGGTYYFNSMFGLGLNAGIADVGDISSDEVSVEASFFPTEQVSLFVMISDGSQETNNVDIDSDAILIGGSLRF
ncbi:MAG: hypothetical protein ACI9SK_001359 [Zhongshania sp.]|jgi:hypothetical protein